MLYYLPYEDGAVIEHFFDFPVMDAAVLVPNDTVMFSSDQFDGRGAVPLPRAERRAARLGA